MRQLPDSSPRAPTAAALGIVSIAHCRSVEERWAASTANAITIQWNTVQASSRETYETGWRCWKQWCEEFGTDPLLRRQPHGWRQADFDVPFPVAALLVFMSWLLTERSLRPGTICGYLSGVRFAMKRQFLDTDFFECEPVRDHKAGLNVVWRLLNPGPAERTLPFNVDLIVHAQRHVFNKGTIHDLTVVTALKLAYSCLMRKSEYLQDPSAAAQHCLRAEHVVFCFSNPDGGSDIRVSSSLAYTQPLERYLGVYVDVASAKNDAEAVGNQFFFTRVVGELPPHQPYDFAVDLYSYAVRAKPRPGQPFLSNDIGQSLHYEHFNACIKRIARDCGLNDALFSTHSLRIGGASALAASGVPDYVIQLQGRWKSLAFLDYIRLASRVFRSTITTLSDRTMQPLSDVRALSDRSLLVGA